jgi:glycine cleavage system H lipoate-binding protein
LDRAPGREKEVSSMTAILVVLTILTFLAVDWARSRRNAVAARSPSLGLSPRFGPEMLQPAAGLYYGPGHTWAQLEPDGSLRVGIDDFARRLVGRIDRIETAAEGTSVARHDAAFVLHQGDKSLGFAAPVDGVITAVNAAALGDPERLQLDRDGDDWLVAVRPRHPKASLRGLRVGAQAGRWWREETARLGDFLATLVPTDALGATLQDGGEPHGALLERLDATAWARFESEFLAG